MPSRGLEPWTALLVAGTVVAATVLGVLAYLADRDALDSTTDVPRGCRRRRHVCARGAAGARSARRTLLFRIRRPCLVAGVVALGPPGIAPICAARRAGLVPERARAIRSGMGVRPRRGRGRRAAGRPARRRGAVRLLCADGLGAMAALAASRAVRRRGKRLGDSRDTARLVGGAGRALTPADDVPKRCSRASPSGSRP